MRGIVIASALVSFFASSQSVIAADLFTEELPQPIVWAGFYIGGHAGAVWNDGGDSNVYKKKKYCPSAKSYGCYWSDWKPSKYLKLDDDDNTGFIGGVHVGYNWQNASEVYGVEADISFAEGLDYLASLRARYGWSQDNLLIYATAGIAFAGFDDKSLDISTAKGKDYGTFELEGENKVGFVAGLGAEYKIDSNMSFGLEGLYYGFASSSEEKIWKSYHSKWKATHADDNDLFVVRARLNYHLQDSDYNTPLK